LSAVRERRRLRLGRHQRPRRFRLRSVMRPLRFEGYRLYARLLALAERCCGLGDSCPQRAVLIVALAPLAHRLRPGLPSHSRGIRIKNLASGRADPASAPATSPEPKKMSPRSGPAIAEPTSCAIINRWNGRPSSSLSPGAATKIGVPRT